MLATGTVEADTNDLGDLIVRQLETYGPLAFLDRNSFVRWYPRMSGIRLHKRAAVEPSTLCMLEVFQRRDALGVALS